jgi:uncharacterized protein (TIGR02001 family)
MGHARANLGIWTPLLAGALLFGLAAPVLADDAGPPKISLSGSAVFTTDYMFRSITNSNQLPAVQPEFDLGYGIFWAYMWGSNSQFGEGIEIDYGAGISPKWKDITFTVGGLAYTFPGANSDTDYFELKSGASWTGGAWTLGLTDYWSPDNTVFDQSNAIEGAVAYAFSSKLWNFFSPSISGTIGFQSYEHVAPDYTYWNAGLTLGFLDHWSADIRYYDTTYSKNDCAIQNGNRNGCDARAVGTLKVTF